MTINNVLGFPMTQYIAELDDTKEVIAVWIKEDTARAPRVFDPKRHIFDTTSSAEFFGAPKEKIETWLSGAQSQSGTSLSR